MKDPSKIRMDGLLPFELTSTCESTVRSAGSDQIRFFQEETISCGLQLNRNSELYASITAAQSDRTLLSEVGIFMKFHRHIQR